MQAQSLGIWAGCRLISRRWPSRAPQINCTCHPSPPPSLPSATCIVSHSLRACAGSLLSGPIFIWRDSRVQGVDRPAQGFRSNPPEKFTHPEKMQINLGVFLLPPRLSSQSVIAAEVRVALSWNRDQLTRQLIREQISIRDWATTAEPIWIKTFSSFNRKFFFAPAARREICAGAREGGLG